MTREYVGGEVDPPRDAPAPDPERPTGLWGESIVPAHLLEQMHRLTLEFREADLERDFRESYRREMLGVGRLAVAIGILLFAVFGLLDPILVDADAILRMWIVRYAIVSPVLVALLAIMLARPRWHFGILYVALLAGTLGIVATILVAGPPANHLYYAGILLVLMYGYAFVRLRFVPAVVVGWTVTAVYLATALWLEPVPRPIFANNAFFLGAANIIGMAASYQLERHTRQGYLLSRRLQRFALRDALTGLFNRRYLDQRLEEQFSRYERYGHAFTLIMIDIDDFKSVNDRYGHTSGDALLRTVARRLLDEVRGGDVVFRYGGDEFVVLAPGTTEERVELMYGRLRHALAELSVPGMPAGVKVRFSAGACQIRDGLDSPREMLEEVSDALRRAKRQGKGRVVLATPPAA